MLHKNKAWPMTGSRASGTYKYHHEDDCVTCEMLTEGTTFQSTMTGKQYKFIPAVSCNDRSVIYLVSQVLILSIGDGWQGFTNVL